ncbi:MAG: hypothetical protein AAGE94_08325 [Acidobacteriota bacterium]
MSTQPPLILDHWTVEGGTGVRIVRDDTGAWRLELLDTTVTDPQWTEVDTEVARSLAERIAALSRDCSEMQARLNPRRSTVAAGWTGHIELCTGRVIDLDDAYGETP